MSNAVSSASQFIISAASSAAPYVAEAAASYAASAAFTAAQNALFGPVRRRSEGPRRDDFKFQTASEGVGIPRLYGRQRLGGQVIWLSDVTETTEVTEQSRGGKSISRSVETTHTEYRYSVSVAIGLCEGEIARIGRVWADGRLVSLHDWNVCIYHGTDDQLPDPLIEAVEGFGNVPAFRGLAYVVIEDLPLAEFGNRLPQFNFEVERPLAARDPDALENLIEAVTLIPGSGESVYNTSEVLVEVEEGTTVADNVRNNEGVTDAEASLGHLVSTLPNAKSVSLVVSWFGNDLRAGECLVEPRFEREDRVLLPEEWTVAGLTRETASPVSTLEGNPAYGGTPSDTGVAEIIAALKSRGLEVMFHPFLLMDIPPDNSLPNTDGEVGQGAYPWRGRITVPSVNDGTAAARTQVEAFFTRYRSMIIHYAQLCAGAGGVERFLLGSELRGLTSVRDEAGAFPGVEALIALAADVRAILGPGTKISYGADWSEYSGYRPSDGSGDVLFPLDDLWADDNIDFVGIDNYMPLSDWRDGEDHLDKALSDSLYDLDYLRSRITAGENYDWYYADGAARDAQVRTSIEDTAHGEDWIFRVKDIEGWWANLHYPRPGGVRAATPTPWVPQSKPVLFTELGCAAIDKAPNQPNVFLDPKSAESAVPYYSAGTRDDLAQRRFIEAHLTYWADEENNPVSAVYGGPMVDISGAHIYAWDARPFPDFPVRGEVWADAGNWLTGHWLNGRAGRVPLSLLIGEIAAASGLATVDASACTSLVTGYMLPRPMAARDALEPLFELYQLDAVERGGVLIVRPRHGRSVAEITEDGLVLTGEEPPFTVNRRQEADLPARLSVTYTDSLSEYDAGVANVTAPDAIGDRAAVIDTAVVLETGEAEGRAEALLAEARAMRMTASFALPAGDMALEPSDVITIRREAAPDFVCRLSELTDGPYRAAEAVRTDPGLYQPRYTGLQGRLSDPVPVYGPVAFAAMDLPILPAGEDGAYVYAAAFAAPWPGEVSVYRGAGTDPALIGGISAQSIMGRLTAPLGAGPLGRWDKGSQLTIRLHGGSLSSLEAAAVLGGAGRAAIKSATGEWEIIAYREAVLETDGSWTLTTLLRGLRGTESETAAGAASGARIVFLSDAQTAEPLSPDLWGLTETWQAGPMKKAPGAFPYKEHDVPLTGSGARPFAPVHLKAEIAGSELAIRWVRRTRIGGDNWQAEDVPLGEAAERYRVRAYAGDGGLLTEAEVTNPAATIPATGVTRVDVEQISTIYGPGRAGILEIP